MLMLLKNQELSIDCDDQFWSIIKFYKSTKLSKAVGFLFLI